MAKIKEAKMAALGSVEFRKASNIDIIELHLTDFDGEEYRHSLWLDGKSGPDKALENAKASLEAYGWDGKELGSLTEARGCAEHIKFPKEGVPVAYSLNEYTDNKGKLHVVNQIKYVVGLGGSSLTKEEVSAIEKRFASLSSSSAGPAESDEDSLI